MKIEIGESLIYSWLRHVKMCRVVQTNWKPSRMWPLREQDKLDTLMRETEKRFRGEYNYHIYKDNKGLLQLLQQAEIDVLGVTMNNEEIACFAVDVAFHLDGANYGSRSETVERIIKKLLRSAMCLCGNIGFKSGEIIFASPKINPAVMVDLKEPIADINRMLREIGFDFNANVIANQDFFEQIMTPVLSVSGNIADTAELFLRSCQLAGMFERSDKAEKQVIVSDLAEHLSAVNIKTTSDEDEPFREYELHHKPCNEREMHIALVQATEAKRTLFYKDGRTHIDIWDTKNYTANSRLANNLGSGPLRDWRNKGIIGIKIEID